MGRRDAPGGYVYHVLNRINEKSAVFQDTGDYAALLSVLREALAFDVVHREVVVAVLLAHLMNGHDVRMLQRCGGPRFGVKPLHHIF